MVISDKLNVLTTGLVNSCTETFKINNLDLNWLVNNSSTVLWADNIFFTKHVEESLFHRDETPLDKSLNLIFETLKDNNIVKFKDSKSIYNDKVSEKVWEQISEDLVSLQNEYGSKIHIDENSEDNLQNIFCDGESYCGPELMSIYASLIMSEEWNAKCLFSERSLNFLKFKLNLPHNHEIHSIPSSFNNIFNLHLPDLPLLHDYAISPNCDICSQKTTCKSDYLNMTEENLLRYIDLREYDEVKQIKEIIYDLNEKINNSDDYFIDSDLLLKEYQEKRNQIRKTMHTTFPKIKKWSNYSLVLFSGAAVGGYLTGSNLLTGLGVGLDAFGAVMQYGLDHFENKNKWISFKVENEFKR